MYSVHVAGYTYMYMYSVHVAGYTYMYMYSVHVAGYTYMYMYSVHVAGYTYMYMYMYMLAEHWTSNPVVTGSNPVRGSSVFFFTVCLRTLPYLLSLLAYFPLCIHMYEIDHV